MARVEGFVVCRNFHAHSDDDARVNDEHVTNIVYQHLGNSDDDIRHVASHNGC